MNLQDQVTSFNMGKKIGKHHPEKFGTGLFFWAAQKENVTRFGNDAFHIMYLHEFADLDDSVVDIQRDYDYYPALTTAELLNLIPPFIKVPGQEPFDCYTFNIKKCSTKHIEWIINYDCDTMQPDVEFIPRKLWPNNIFGEHLPDLLAEVILRISEIKRVSPHVR